ncbi:hypothetical protein [Arthrobacter psychrolactophilus]
MTDELFRDYLDGRIVVTTAGQLRCMAFLEAVATYGLRAADLGVTIGHTVAAEAAAREEEREAKNAVSTKPVPLLASPSRAWKPPSTPNAPSAPTQTMGRQHCHTETIKEDKMSKPLR